MRYRFKMDYLKSIKERYRQATRAIKKQILDEFCEVCSFNRKYAIWLLNQSLKNTGFRSNKTRKPPNEKYNASLIKVLEHIWDASGYLWSSRLKALLPVWMPWIKAKFNLTQAQQQQLLAMSAATMDRRLKTKKLGIKKKIYGTTKPGTLLKQMIPVKTDCWDITHPGFLEIDLVSHSGASAEGEFLYTLDTTDIHTAWNERRAVYGRGQTNVLAALKDIAEALPFKLKGIDSDNDSAFINNHLKAFCDKDQIQFTRSRAYKKNDNAHIEQKNWTHVRKLFGYVRYDSEEALTAMNSLYINELRWFQNFFQPSVKLKHKLRLGSKLKRVYDKPQTPFQRVCACKNINKVKVYLLNKQFQSLNPFELSQAIDDKIQNMYHLAARKANIKKYTSAKYLNELTEMINRYANTY